MSSEIKKNELLLEQTKKEAEHFDQVYSDADNRHKLENYSIPQELIRQVTYPRARPLIEREYSCFLLGNLEGKKILDYGAGDGWNTVCFAMARARIWAIDISEKGIELTKKKAEANGVSERVTAEVQNCYETKFPSDMFDIIYGGGVLHHLDLDAAGKELSRIIRADGVAVFLEPIRETMIMDIIKSIVLRITGRKPLEETEDESPLTKKRIDLLKTYFKIVNCRYFNVLSSAGLLFESKAIKSFLLWADYFLITFIPGYKKLGRAVVIELRHPNKKPHSLRG